MKNFKIINDEHNYSSSTSDNTQRKVGIYNSNILIEVSEYDSFLTENLHTIEKMNFIFSEKITNENIYKAFLNYIPSEIRGTDFDEAELDLFLDSKKNNKGYYSFIAEALTPIILKEIYGFELIRSILSIFKSPNAESQGSDVCLYSENDNLLVLGEAKFYKNFPEAISSLKKSFNNYGEKANDLQTAFGSSEYWTENVARIMMLNDKILDDNSSKILTKEKFQSIRKMMVGFILHENQSKYENHLHKFEGENMTKMINGFGNVVSIMIIHLPVISKRDLIKKIILESKEKIDG